MRFEEALKCMREGKKVIRPIVHFVPRMIKDDRFVEVYTTTDNKEYYCGIACIESRSILAEDWEVVEDDNK